MPSVPMSDGYNMLAMGEELYVEGYDNKGNGLPRFSVIVRIIELI